MSALPHIRFPYKVIDNEMHLYSGVIEVSIGASVETKSGDLVLTFGDQPALWLRLRGREPWLRDMVLSTDRPTEVGIPESASLAPPSTPPETGELEAGFASISSRLIKVDGGDFSLAKKVRLQVAGRLTRLPLPSVQTTAGRQGQVSFALPGWDLVLAVCDDQPFGDQFMFVVEATPDQAGTIDTDSIDTLCRMLLRLLSFISGTHIGIVPIVGLDQNDDIVAARWAAPRFDLQRTPWRWCYEGDVSNVLPELAAGRTAIESDPVMASCVDRAISLYLSANGPEVLEVKIPVASSGLELLAWSALQQYNVLTSQQIDSLSAGGQSGQFLAWAGVPSGLPNMFPALSQRRTNLNKPSWTAIEIVFNVRNKLIHPPNSVHNIQWPKPEEMVEAWQLATWFFELGILRLLGYQGKYTSRLQLNGWAGQTEAVPWV